VPGHPYQLEPVMFCQLHQRLMAVPDQFEIYLSERKYMFLPAYPFSIFSITQALMAYISAWNNVLWSPRLKAVSPSQGPSIHPSTSAFIGLPFPFVSELDQECLVVHISQMRPV